jgi:type I restriction enzyme, S subunit
MKDWKEYKLGEVIQFGNGKERPRTEGDIPVFGGNGILGYCNQSNYKDETIIIGRVGAYCGSVFYQNRPIWVSDNALAVKPKGNFKIKFLYYFLQNLGLNYFAEGSSHPLVTQTLLNSIEVSITDNEKEQTAIISILSTLDDNIDLLHRQNKTLEQLAETFFRQWFVEEAEESWEEITLSEIAEHKKGNINPAKNPDKLYEHYSLPSFDELKEPVVEIGKDILSNKSKAVSNSILVSKLNPRTPRIWMLYGRINEDECICSTEFQVVKPKSNIWLGFIYCFLKSNQVTQELAGASGGTSGSHQRINPQDIFNLRLFKPSENLIERFDNITNNY